MTSDTIHIRGLRLSVRIGVPDEERALRQTLELDATLVSAVPFDEMRDDLSRTIDYQAVADHLRRHAGEGEWRLIETLASELAAEILAHFPVVEVALELRKFILPGTDCVAVGLTRRA